MNGMTIHSYRDNDYEYTYVYYRLLAIYTPYLSFYQLPQAIFAYCRSFIQMQSFTII